jgi:hypothetical protein
VLSTPVRAVRRSGLEPRSLKDAPEAALRILAAATVTLAVALLVFRWSA